MATTELISGDLTASLTFFLSNELLSAFRNVLSTSQLIILSLLVAIVARAAEGWLEDSRPGGAMLAQTRDELQRLARTTAFLASTCTVQIGVLLVRDSVFQPAARIVSIVATLALLRVVLSSVRLQRQTLKTD